MGRRAGASPPVALVWPDSPGSNSDEYPTKATRPAWSVLDTGKLRGVFDITLPDWQTALDEVILELAQRRT